MTAAVDFLGALPAQRAADVLEALRPTATEYGASRDGERRRCPRAAHLKYHLKIAPTSEAIYFAVGRYVHACLEYVQRGVLRGEAEPRKIEDVIGYLRATRDTEPRWDEIDPIDEAEWLAGNYFAAYGYANAGWPEGWTIDAVELPLAGEICGVPITARADTILRIGGEIVIADHKTRSKALPKDREDYARGLRTRDQFLRLSWLVREHYRLDYAPAVIVNAMIKTQMPKFDRLRVAITELDLDRWREATALNRELDAKIDGWLADREPPANYHACAPEIGSRCSFFDWCHSGSDEVRDRKYRRID